MSTKYSLYIPYDEDLIKSLRIAHKLKWDKDAKYWYTTNIETWNSLQQFHKTYYDVPFDAKDIVKKYGYKWDSNTKHWYGCDYIRRQNMEDLAEFEPIDI